MTRTQLPVLTAQKKRTDWYLVYSVLIMLILCALGNLSNFVVSAFVLMMALPLIAKPEYLLGIIFFTTVFDEYIIFSAGQSFSRFFILFFLFGTLIRYLPNLHKMLADMRFWYFCVFFFMGILFSFYGLEGYTSSPISFCLNLLLMLFMSYYSVKNADVLTEQLWLTAAIGSLYSLWMLTSGGIDVFEAGRVDTFAGGVNANEAAMGLCVITIILFSRFVTAKKKRLVLNTILLSIAVVSLFLTGSRSGLLGALAGVIVVILIWMKQNGRNVIKGILICAAMAMVFVLLFNYMQEEFPVLMERFTVEDVMESGGTGRTDIWRAYFTHYFPDYWAFGIGFDPLNLYVAVKKVTGEGHGAHNALVDILSSSGVFGLSVYVGFLWQIFHRIGKQISGNKNFLLIVGLVSALLVNGIGENIIRGRFFWFTIGLAFILLNSCEQKKHLDNARK